jgi:hypothetical protein
MDTLVPIAENGDCGVALGLEAHRLGDDDTTHEK